MANISAIFPGRQIQDCLSKNESFDFSYTDRKQLLMYPKKEQKRGTIRTNRFNSDVREEFSPDQFREILDTSYTMTEEEMENDIDNLNKDIFDVANDLEQLKKMLIEEESSKMEDEGN